MCHLGTKGKEREIKSVVVEPQKLHQGTMPGTRKLTSTFQQME